VDPAETLGDVSLFGLAAGGEPVKTTVLAARGAGQNGHLKGSRRSMTASGSSRLVRGDTDSERFFALVPKEIAMHDGDPRAGPRLTR
jgi:hypothetical protein